MPFPFLYRFSLDKLSFTCDIGRNAQFRLRTTGFQNLFQHFMVAVRRLNKQLGLVLGIHSGLQLLQPAGTVGRLNG